MSSAGRISDSSNAVSDLKRDRKENGIGENTEMKRKFCGFVYFENYFKEIYDKILSWKNRE